MSYLAYHEGTAQTGGGAFQSMTDALDPAPAVIPKQHFVEPFSGSALDSIWTVEQGSSGTDGMDDAVNGGWQGTTAATSSDFVRLLFNDIRHYANDGAISIWVTKTDSTSNINSFFNGMSSSNNDFGHNMLAYMNDGNANYFLSTYDTVSTNNVASSVAKDTNYHKHQTEAQSASVTYHIDDVLEAISTSNLPGAAMQPLWRIRTSTTAAKKGNISYMECFNT